MTDTLFPIFGTKVAPMIGRAKAMDRLWRELTKPTPSHLQIVGPRFAGKTVLLHAVADRMRQEDSPFQVVLVWDLGHRTPESNEAFIEMLCDRVATALKDTDSPFSNELRGLEPDDRYGTLKEVLDVLDGEGVRLLLLLDGFDKPLAGGKLSRNLWDQLRELGSLPNLRYVTASRKPLSQLIRSEESATSDFWNIFDQSPIRVGTFDEDDVSEVIARLPFQLESGARTELANWTGKFPPLLLGVLNEIGENASEHAVGPSRINGAAAEARRGLDDALAFLWRDLPTDTQDRFRDLLDRGQKPLNEIGHEHLSRLHERGFVTRTQNNVRPACRLLQDYLGETGTDSGGMARLFDTWDRYASNIREVLERRLAQLDHVDTRLRRLVQRAIEDIPDHADDCLNSLTGIQELALDVIWEHELGPSRTLPEGLWDRWNWFESNNRTVQNLKDYVERRIPSDRFLQCRMLEFLTGSRAKFDPTGRFGTKDMYVLVDAIHTFRNRVQHGDGETMHTGVAVAGLMLCIELLACIDRRTAEISAGA